MRPDLCTILEMATMIRLGLRMLIFCATVMGIEATAVCTAVKWPLNLFCAMLASV